MRFAEVVLTIGAFGLCVWLGTWIQENKPLVRAIPSSCHKVEQTLYV